MTALESGDKIGFWDADGFQHTGIVTQTSANGRQIVVEHKHSDTLYLLVWDESRGSWVEET